MQINNIPYRTIWLKNDDPTIVQIIDQRHLPHRLVIEDLRKMEDVFTAIRDMHVRGAPLIGAAAGYGMYLAALHFSEDGFDEKMNKAGEHLKTARPTAVNLAYAVDRALSVLKPENSRPEKVALLLQCAHDLTEESVEHCRLIGQHGLQIIERIANERRATNNHQQTTINILTHCNAGWLACVDYGTATAPIYAAHDAGIPVHVWVDETRPRNQGASLTAFELKEHGVPHTVIADNTGGHLMQHGLVDLVIVGSDRTTRTGDVANKIGTYLKALAAQDNGVPFYVALPTSTIDWDISDGLREIPIEQRDGDEVHFIEGMDEHGGIQKVRLTPEGSPAANYAFDVTPARLVTGLITEWGVCSASEAGIQELMKEGK